MVATIDLSGNLKFKNQTIDLKNANSSIDLGFQNDVEGQIVVKESGKNIVVTAYAKNEDDSVNYKKFWVKLL